MEKKTYKDFKKSKLHQTYTKKDGIKVPGATTIIRNLSWGQPFLDRWRSKMFREGIDPDAAMRTAGELGTLTHYFIECHLNGVKPELDEFGESFIVQAEKNLNAFQEWEKRNNFHPSLVEYGFASEIYEYGGTIDLVGTAQGEKILFDIKTSKGIYSKHKIQIEAYARLYEEHMHEYLPIAFLHIRDGRCNPVWVYEKDRDDLWRAFKCCLELEELRKKID